MKKFEGILICTDLDGPLLKTDKTISKENLDAIEYFKAEGGYFTFITGRVPYISGEICEKIKPNAPFGCINGGGVYDHVKGEYVFLATVPHSVHSIVKAVAEALPEVGFQYDLADKIYFCRENDVMAKFRKNTGVPNLVRNFEDITEPIAKIILGTSDDDVIDRLISIVSNHPVREEVNCVRAEHDLYDIIPKGVNKGTALVQLAEHLGVDMSKTVAIGDYDNDIAMLSAAGVGVAVANATDGAKAVAEYITVSNNENAVARVISDIEEGRLKI